MLLWAEGQPSCALQSRTRADTGVVPGARGQWGWMQASEARCSRRWVGASRLAFLQASVPVTLSRLLQTTFGCRYGYTKNHFFSVTSDGSHKTSVSDGSFPVKERATCAPALTGVAWPECTRGAGAPDGDSG